MRLQQWHTIPLLLLLLLSHIRCHEDYPRGLSSASAAGGYKGYGLSMMVEILCGILADSNYGPNIRSWNNSTSIAKLVSPLHGLIINVFYCKAGRYFRRDVSSA